MGLDPALSAETTSLSFCPLSPGPTPPDPAPRFQIFLSTVTIFSYPDGHLCDLKRCT